MSIFQLKNNTSRVRCVKIHGWVRGQGVSRRMYFKNCKNTNDTSFRILRACYASSLRFLFINIFTMPLYCKYRKKTIKYMKLQRKA